MKRPDLGAIPEPNLIPTSQVQEQLDRILHSQVFRNAVTLQRLLSYIATRGAKEPSAELKEYTIGCEVFGRGSGYDPKVDTIVRVEVHRLRQKLEDYYKSEGTGDPVLIEIPRGRYSPHFALRIPQDSLTAQPEGAAEPIPSPAHPPALESTTPLPEKRSGISPLNQVLLHPLALALLATAIFGLGLTVGARWIGWRIASKGMLSSARANLSAAQGADSVQDFWAGILKNETISLVGYPDAVFLIDETNDLFRFRRGASDDRGAPVNHSLAEQFASNPSLVSKAGPLFYENGYTGVGELEGVCRLASLFTRMGLPLIVKRADEMTVGDFKEHNVILLGSSFQNKAVAQIPLAGEFQFNQPDRRRELWRGRILNLHPHPGEKPLYQTERDPVTQILMTDYALMTVQPGVEPSRLVALLGGLDTAGTAGAIEFATSQPGIEALTRSLASLGDGAKKGGVTLFQAVLKVDLANGRDVRDVRLVAVHALGQGSISLPVATPPAGSQESIPSVPR